MVFKGNYELKLRSEKQKDKYLETGFKCFKGPLTFKYYRFSRW